ncbi:MAG: hypothetical protein MSH25_08905 [Desulfovibrio sp.]|uniref:hypothetical protein n=1 Tax=Desulfovibrio sp. TaxID=885 RepID=UPI0025C5E39F|nr:hypothetical protein [Desulfovibrio sp.]MCI7569467.1 hypothetical protein [Desulfovibrio sp.]
MTPTIPRRRSAARPALIGKLCFSAKRQAAGFETRSVATEIAPGLVNTIFLLISNK